ncbi:MAG: TlpA family protein disulfide reductase, partial [Deltaproteobacteria bacterium]|nr:TlpA family protein disulfide reductase [Deltaproteobacteria bacterium]
MRIRTKLLPVLTIVTVLAPAVACLLPAVPACAASSRPQAQLELLDLNGKPRSLGELRGKVVLVNFWATWCGPCIGELPVLAELAERYRAAGFVVVAASVDDAETRDEVEAFARKRGKGLEVWIGAGAGDMAAAGLKGNAVPATLLLDRSGRIAQRAQGAVSPGELDQLIEKLLKEASSGPDSPQRPPISPHKPRGLPEAAAPPLHAA